MLVSRVSSQKRAIIDKPVQDCCHGWKFHISKYRMAVALAVKPTQVPTSSNEMRKNSLV